MPSPIIKIDSAPDGTAKITCDVSAAVVLTDVAGGAPSSRLWEVFRWPHQLGSPPTLATPTTDTSGWTPGASEDGAYIIQLTRVDSGITTVARNVVGVRNRYGRVWPCPGLTGKMLNVGATLSDQEKAQLFGWEGGSYANTDILKGAFMRALDPYFVTTTKTGNYPAEFGDFVGFNPSGGTFTITLPSPVTADGGRGVSVKNVTSNATAITINGNGNNIDGASTFSLGGAWILGTFVWNQREGLWMACPPA